MSMIYISRDRDTGGIDRKMRRGMPALWGLVKPLIVYYVGYYVLRMVVGTLLLGGGMAFLMEDGSSIVNGIAMLGGCAALFPMIEEEREEQKKERKGQRKTEVQGEESSLRRAVWGYPALFVFAAACVVFFNTLMVLSGLTEQSMAYQETAKRQYAVSLGMGLLLYVGISAIVEEVVFRFLLYNRLRRSCDRVAFGVVASAFLFGVYHGNIVQGIYAFVLGSLIALVYVYYDSFFAPVLFHGVGNAVIFVCNMIPEAYELVFSPFMFWIFGLITVAGSAFLIREVGKAGKPD